MFKGEIADEKGKTVLKNVRLPISRIRESAIHPIQQKVIILISLLIIFEYEKFCLAV
jgi:hypothetical protein